MTFRAKSAVKRTHRPAYEADHRRALFMTLGFGAVVVVSLLILGGAAVASWYTEHLENVAVVGGQGISKDAFRDQYRVQEFLLEYQETQIRQAMQDGKLDATSGQSRIDQITQQRQNLGTDAIDKLIDATLWQQLATTQGVAVTDQQVTEAMQKIATTPESRHLWLMGAKPKVSPGATAPTDEQKAAAKADATAALNALKAGTPWADVAKTLTDDLYSSQGGDAGWTTKDASVIDKKVLDAMFTLPVNGLTDVIEGDDGSYHIGRVTEIQPESTDAAFEQKIKDQGVGLDAFKKVVRADAVQQALDDKVLADVVDKPTPQRHVGEIFLAAPAGQEGTGDEVQVRHILYAPNDDAQAAQTLDPNDPAWKKAEDEANAAYAELQKDPTKFEDMAKSVSDDTGTKADGGLLPYYSRVNLDKAFGDAVFADGLQKDQILAPVKSSFGWHVIQFLDRRKPARDRMQEVIDQAKAPGADFAALAKQYSEDTTKDTGGDAGWIARNQLDSAREIAIFQPPVGQLTEPITTANGIYLYKILDEQTRLPDADQVTTLRSDAFSNWFTAQKNGTRIERLYESGGSSLPTVQ